MTHKELVKLLSIVGCGGGRKWVIKNGYDLQQGWDNCKRADWLLYILSLSDCSPQMFISAKLSCINIIEGYINDERTLISLDIGRRYIRGQVSENILNKAAQLADEAETDTHQPDYNEHPSTAAAIGAVCGAIDMDASPDVATDVAYSYALRGEINCFQTAKSHALCLCAREIRKVIPNINSFNIIPMHFYPSSAKLSEKSLVIQSQLKQIKGISNQSAVFIRRLVTVDWLRNKLTRPHNQDPEAGGAESDGMDKR